MNVKPLKLWPRAIVGELNLELQLIPLDTFTAYRAGLTYPRSAPSTVGEAGRQLSSTDRFSGLLSDDGFVEHSGR
jgi:hypothetical protein